MTVTANNDFFIVKSKPDYIADNEADALAFINQNPQSYDGKYFVILDKPIGEQVYIFEKLALSKAHGYGYVFDNRNDSARYYDQQGALLQNVAIRYFNGFTDNDGLVVIHATDDLLETGIPFFSLINDVSIGVYGSQSYPIPSDIKYVMGAFEVIDEKTVKAQVFYGDRNVFRIGIPFDALRTAQSGTPVRVRVEGIL